MIAIPHHAATDGVGAWWRYDPVRRVVFLVMPRVTAAIDVCSTCAPRFGAYPVIRTGDAWRIVPARFTARSVRGALLTEEHPLHDALGYAVVELRDAPEHVHLELSDLSRE